MTNSSRPLGNPIRLGIIGLGHWGPNLVRTFRGHAHSKIQVLCDMNQDRLKLIQESYPEIKVTTHSQDVISSPEVDAVVIATPTITHYALVKAALEKGKHVLVEKPLALTVQDCEALTDLAKNKGLELMVGHVFLFNPAVLYVGEMVKKGELGEIVYGYSTRVNLGPVRYDVNALWDLAPHDISIFNYWLQCEPLSAQATGLTHLQPGIEDVVFVSLRYPKNTMVNLHVGWLDPRKTRQIVLVGTKKMVVFDDLNPLGPVQIYDKSVTLNSSPFALTDSVQAFKALIQEGNFLIPHIPMGEPLKKECESFIQSILHQKANVSDGQVGTAVVKVLEAATRSLKSNGQKVAVNASVESRLPLDEPRTLAL